MSLQRVQIHSIEELRAHVARGASLRAAVVQGVSLSASRALLDRVPVHGAVFLGCDLPDACAASLVARGAAIFPSVERVPYNPYRGHLYTAEELYAGFDPQHPETLHDTLDQRIYRHYLTTGKEQPGLLESLMRRLHDLAMSDAKADLLTPDTRAVAVMGGHALLRTDPIYADVVRLGRGLARQGYLPISGGGPGAMEATHLGALLAPHADGALNGALSTLATAPSYKAPRWLGTAMRVRESLLLREPSQQSLAVPTWLYGHEPPTPFASHIAKYFANAIREDGLVTIARHGIVFTPGSAGTVQEVFQDNTQNHYQTLGEYSPMVFLGRRFWTEEIPVVPLMRSLGAGRPYLQSVGVVDTPEEALAFIASHPPVPSEG